MEEAVDGLLRTSRGARSSAWPIDQPSRYPYQPALDGVRAVAVSSVLLYHFGVGTASGGFLGVDVFLVLSGFLITTLLLREHAGTGHIRIAQFYGRRARRLLPGLFLVLGAVVAFARIAADEHQLVKLRGDALSSLFYVANWRFILSGNGYFDHVSPSPLTHLWSLAIEEQWYLLFPLAVVGLISLIGPPIGRERGTWVRIMVAGAITSAALMAALVNDANFNRVYYGTDTRAQALFIGTTLAILMYSNSFSRQAQRRLDLLGLLGLAGCVAMFWQVAATDQWMYRGGFALIAIFAAFLISGAISSSYGVTQRLLSIPPLPELGRISYGIYLWHWPVFVYLDEVRTGLSGAALLIVRCAVTILISIASYSLVERPIRERAWHSWRPAIAAVAAAAVLATVVVGLIPGPPRANALVDPTTAGSRARAKGRRVLVAGDSVAFTLASGYRSGSLSQPTTVADTTIIGCGLEFPDSLCSHVFDRWRRSIDGFDPATTVLIVGRWEALDRVINGRSYPAGSKQASQFVLGKLMRGLRILTSRGGSVVLFNVESCFPGFAGMYYKPSAARWLDGLFRQAADRLGPRVQIVDYASFVCSAGSSPGILGDGLHFTPSGAEQAWKWLDEQAVFAARPS